MGKGTNSRKVNERLRGEVRGQTEARARLERRLAAAERERDELRNRMLQIDSSTHPAIEAERQRTAHFEGRAREARAAERAEWEARCEIVKNQLVAFFRQWDRCDNCREAAVMQLDVVDVMVEMFGNDWMAASTVLGTRQIRRNTRTGGETRRTLKRAEIEGIGKHRDG